MREVGDCCALVFTETWLNGRITEEAIRMEGPTIFRADRGAALSGNTGGPGVVSISVTETQAGYVLIAPPTLSV